MKQELNEFLYKSWIHENICIFKMLVDTKEIDTCSLPSVNGA